MKSPGFSILEIVMVMAVSGIIMTCLLEIYNQTARNMTKVERFIFEDTQVLTLKNRIGKDISGLSSIWFKESELAALQAAQEKKEAPKNTRKCSYYFYSTNKGEQFDMLTFMTTGGLKSFGLAADRYVRVVYQLEKDPAHEGLFRLMRKEINPATEFIDEVSLKQGKFYELIGGIKSFDVTYQLVDRVALNKQLKAGQKPKGDATVQDNGQDAAPIIRSVKQWYPIESRSESNKSNGSQDTKNTEEKSDAVAETDEEKQDLGGAPVPRFIELKIVFGATGSQNEKEYRIDFYVPSTLDNMPKSILSMKPSLKKDEGAVAPDEKKGNPEGKGQA